MAHLCRSVVEGLSIGEWVCGVDRGLGQAHTHSLLQVSAGAGRVSGVIACAGA